MTAPEAVTRGTVRLYDERRYHVPVTLICPEFTPDEARESIEAGQIPELARATRLTMVDLASGHWPMLSCPADLAAVLHTLASELDGEAA